MPEGDAIFRTARVLERALCGRIVRRFESVFPHLTRIDDDAPLAGRSLDRIWSVGKHLLMAFSGELVLRTHMRMNGSWHVYRLGEPWRRPRMDMRIVIETDAFAAVAFNVQIAEFLGAHQLSRSPELRALGPDLLSDPFDEADAIARLRARDHQPIGDALLDQRAVAGIGNVYKSEVCFVCRVNPFSPVETLTDDQLRQLLAVARRLMLANVGQQALGRIVTYRTLQSQRASASHSDGLWVYGRRGRPCRRCGTAIVSEKRGEDARVTYWCPQCAPEGPSPPG